MEYLRDNKGKIDPLRIIFGLVGLLAIFGFAAYVYGLAFYGNPPMTVNSEYVTIENKTVKQGADLIATFDYCAHVTDPAILRIRWVDGISYAEPERTGVVYPVGCVKRTIHKEVPNIPPGEYHLQWELVFKYPVRTRTVIFYSETFTIID